MTVASIKKPISCLKVSIQRPGCGNSLVRPGKKEISKNGNAIPSPSAEKTAKEYVGCKVAANPIAEPKSGPVQGVATKVASTPLTKEEQVMAVQRLQGCV